MITEQVKNYIDKSVLCWLATANLEGEPNVSPKEMFTYKDDTTLLIANIASPNSVANIRENPNVCLSFVDIFIQKGFKLKGVASLINPNDKGFSEAVQPLIALFSDRFPIQAVIEIKVTSVAAIQAPSYFLFDHTTAQSQVDSAMKTYGVCPAEPGDPPL